MHKIKEVIRLKAANLPLRTIASASKLSLGAVAKYVKAAEQAGLSWPLPADLSDEALQRLLGGIDQPAAVSERYIAPDCAAIHQELKRKGVTLQLLWHEYRDLRNGVYGHIGLHYDAEKTYFNFRADDIGYRDQKYELDGGRRGSFTYHLGYDEIPHNFTFGTTGRR